MKRVVVFVLGVAVGQWLAAAAPTSQTERRSPAVQTLERRDATGVWTREWPAPLSGRVVGSWRQLVGLPAGVATGGDEVAVPLELARGVWMAQVSLNGGRPARFVGIENSIEPRPLASVSSPPDSAVVCWQCSTRPSRE